MRILVVGGQSSFEELQTRIVKDRGQPARPRVAESLAQEALGHSIGHHRGACPKGRRHRRDDNIIHKAG